MSLTVLLAVLLNLAPPSFPEEACGCPRVSSEEFGLAIRREIAHTQIYGHSFEDWKKWGELDIAGRSF